MNPLLVIFFSSLFIISFISIGYIVVLIHSKKKIVEEQQLRYREVELREQKYKALFENSIIGMFKAQLPLFTIMDVNTTALNILQVKTSDEFQNTIKTLSNGSIDHIINELSANKEIISYEILLHEYGWISLSARMGEENIVYGAITDVTERKEYEEKIAQQAELLNQTHDAIFVIGTDRKVIFWNKSAEGLYHITKDHIVGKRLNEVLFSKHDYNLFEHILAECEEAGTWSGEYINVTKGGKDILVEAFWRTISSKHHHENYYLIVHTDITEKRKYELKTLRAQKLESIALLASSIAHDLQNILAPVSISIELLKEEPNNPNNGKVLDAVEESTKHGLALVKKILAFGKSVTGEKISVDINSLVEKTLETFAQTNIKSIEIEKHFPKGKYHVYADIEQIKQVFMNLFTNAFDAMDGKGKLRVGVRRANNYEEIVEDNPHLDFEDLVEIEVGDTGEGISKANVAKIFDPFFTTKDGDRATGLGLPIVQNIIRNHGGAITVASKVGHGTIFRIYLPLSETARPQ